MEVLQNIWINKNNEWICAKLNKQIDNSDIFAQSVNFAFKVTGSTEVTVEFPVIILSSINVYAPSNTVDKDKGKTPAKVWLLPSGIIAVNVPSTVSPGTSKMISCLKQSRVAMS